MKHQGISLTEHKTLIVKICNTTQLGEIKKSEQRYSMLVNMKNIDILFLPKLDYTFNMVPTRVPTNFIDTDKNI